MRRCPLFVLVWCLLSCLSLGVVRAEEDTAYIRAEVIAPVWSNDPLLVRILPDPYYCRKTYGDEWSERCFISLGREGQQESGVLLTSEKGGLPALPKGTWRWHSTNVLAFTPETRWEPKTNFTVDLSGLYLPRRAVIENRIVRGTTLPLAGQIAPGEVWIDPSVSGPRSVSFALLFTSPPGKAIEQRVTLQSRDTSLVFGPTQFIWGQDGVSCLVQAPVTTLPSADAQISLTVQGVRPLVEDEGRVKLLNGDLYQTVAMPGKAQLFRVKRADFKLESTGTLAQEYHLALNTSLRVPAAELLKALKVVELPRTQSAEATVPYSWQEAPAVVQADLDRGRPLSVELVSDPGESGEPVVVRVPATPGSFVYCTLPAGFGPAGYPLQQPWTGVFQATPPEGFVSFLQPGNVLTLTPDGNNKLDIVSSGADAVRWRATRVRNADLKLLEMTTSSYERFRPYSTLDMLGTAVEGVLTLPAVRENDLTPRFSTLDLGQLMAGGTGFIFVELTGLRDGESIHEEWVGASRLVLVTDLGMVVKVMPDGVRQVFVCSLSAGQPVEGASVHILGINGEPVAEARTDATGLAVLPAVDGLTREKQPVALVATHTVQGATPREDVAWMALDDSDRRVDYSRFSTQGQVSSSDNLNAYVFGQRGVFRPGEVLRFGLVVRRGDWQPLPADMPLVATLHDPAGRVAVRRSFTVGQGLAEFEWTSSEKSPTGRYRLDVTTPASESVLGSGVVRVEEFQPDTLAIRAEVLNADKSVARGWLVTSANPTQTAVAVYLRNFYGLPAEGRKVRVGMSVNRASLAFAGFEDFIFPDVLPPSKDALAASTVELSEAVTAADGEVQVPLPLTGCQNRTMQCTLLVEGFEPDGGRAVSTETTFLASPLPVMLGYRLSGAVNALDYVPKGTVGGLELVAIDADLRPADPGPLRLSVAERRYVTVLTTDAQGKYVYEESPVDKDIASTTAQVNPVSGRLEWTMPTTAPGEFLLTVRTADNRVMARVPFTVAGNDDLRPALNATPGELQSTQLRLRLDKTDYAPGDTVNLFMAAPYDGVGLITLERDRVATHAWFKAPAGHSVHTLTIPRDFEGRGYINVTMGRAVSSPDIFMQPHSYGVVPLTVNVAARDMGLKLEAPQVVLPGNTLSARLTSRQPGKALVFAVDEGVLQLTHFATPDPLRYLLLDRALEVSTDQLFDLLMPVHTQIGKRLPAFGGDMSTSGGRFQNPFKRRSEPPLAWWSGVVDTSEQGTEVHIPIPSYTNGQVRIMAVAVSPDTAGSTAAATQIRAPLVLAPQLPLMTAPGDLFEGGVNLHNTTDKPLSVTLTTEVVGLRMEQNLPEKLEIPAGKEQFLPVRCVASDTPGEASLTVAARVAEPARAELNPEAAPPEAAQTYRRTATLSVRPAVLPRQEQEAFFGPSGTAGGFNRNRDLLPYRAMSTVSVSSAPLPPLRVLLHFLAAYPYDCVEQSISRALPLVLLQRRPGLTDMLTQPVIDGKPRAEVHARVLERALSAIRGGLREERGVLPWPDAQSSRNDNGASILLTAYAGDYLLALREAGLSVPGDLGTGYFETLLRVVNVAPETLGRARDKAYGLWVLTRAGFVTSQYLDGLKQTLVENWPGWEKDVTASLMAGCYAIMNMRSEAEALIAGSEGKVLKLHDGSGLTVLAAQSLHVSVLARHFPERLRYEAGDLSRRLLENLNTGSTLGAALGARALLELALAPNPAPQASPKAASQASDPLAGAALECTKYAWGFTPVEDGSDSVAQTGQTAQATANLPAILSLSVPGCSEFALTGTGEAPLFWEQTTDGYDRKPPTEASGTGLKVTRTFRLSDGTVLGPNAVVPQGTVVRVDLSVQRFGNGDELTPVVLADLLPGGFEMVLSHPADVLPEPRESGGDDEEGELLYTRLDRLEDRVIAHTSVRERGTPVSFTYHLRAVNRGHYQLPAAYAEGLYDRTLSSHTAAGTITIQ